ncbi:hypothetical protein IV102_32430 [bacterium]|nr:hypothetical protein [bacterium]
MGPGFAYLDGTQIQPAEIKSLALETIEFLEAEPFDEINGDDILRVEGLHVSPVYISVLGMAEIEYGLGIYLTRETAVAYGKGISDELAARLPALSLTMVTEDDCPPGLDVEIRKNRWPCHPTGFPLLMRVDGERVQPDSEEIQLAVDCLKAVRLFAETERAGKYRVGERDVQVEWPGYRRRAHWPG